MRGAGRGGNFPQVGVTPEDAVRALRARISSRTAADQAAEARARELLPRLAAELRRAGATRVLLFGSLADGFFRAHSDIDIAVSGIPEPVLARLEREWTILADRPVELANLDALLEPLRRRIEESAEEIP